MSCKALELSEKMGFGSRLNASEAGFNLTFYDYSYPADQERVSIRIDNWMFQAYIAALADNWRTLVTLRQTMPSLDFSVKGKLGMRLDKDGLHFQVIRMESEAEVEVIANFLRNARVRGAEMYKNVLTRIGRVVLTAEEKRERFEWFLAEKKLGRSSDPVVVRELAQALGCVRWKLEGQAGSCRYVAGQALSEGAVGELMEDLRMHGLTVHLEGGDFLISWDGVR